MDQNNSKIVTLGFVVMSILVGLAVSTILKVLAATWGVFARIYDNDLVRHGIPFLAGFVLFLVMISNKGIRDWGSDVVNEISKIVWPSRRDTTSLTLVVSFIILFAGLLLWIIDIVSTNLVNLIIT